MSYSPEDKCVKCGFYQCRCSYPPLQESGKEELDIDEGIRLLRIIVRDSTVPESLGEKGALATKVLLRLKSQLAAARAEVERLKEENEKLRLQVAADAAWDQDAIDELKQELAHLRQAQDKLVETGDNLYGRLDQVSVDGDLPFLEQWQHAVQAARGE